MLSINTSSPLSTRDFYRQIFLSIVLDLFHDADAHSPAVDARERTENACWENHIEADVE